MPIRAISLKKMAKDLDSLASDLARGEVRAMNRTRTTLRKTADQSIRMRLNLKSRDVKAALSASAAAPGKLTIAIRARLRGIPIQTQASGKAHYKGRQTAKGITFKPYKGAGRELIEGGFSHSDFAGSRAFKRRGKSRLPIKNLYGPSVFSEFQKPRVQSVLARTWDQTIDKNLRAEERFALRKRGFRV